MLRVYVAGAYSADNVPDVLGNMRRGIKLSVEVLKHGMAPFCPWLDFQFGLHDNIMIEEYYEYSIAWLKVAEAVLVVSQGYEESVGTQREIQIARANGIPVFHDIGSLIEWRDKYPEAKAGERVRRGLAPG